jgi:PhoH-like ATPase
LELEDKKKGMQEIGYQAREFARLIASCTVKKVVKKEAFKVVKLIKDDLKIHLITKDKYESDLEYKYIAESNDKRIVECCEVAQKYYKGSKVTFVSLDVYARTSALFKNIKTETLNNVKDKVPPFQFFKSINVESNYFNQLHGAKITDYDESHNLSNSCFEFSSSDGNKAYGIINSGIIDIMEDSDFNGLSVKPINIRQKFLSKAIISNDYDLMVVDAKAGSGKTLMAISCAMRLIDKGQYDKIIYVRNSIESVDKGAEVGFLSGNDEKFRIYNMALYDTLEFIARSRHGKKATTDKIDEEVEKLQDKYGVETLWPGEARGRTLSGAIVIMDEWQNSSVATCQLILSRLDNKCLAIVIGSNRQIDNMYLSKFNNGLTALQKQTRLENDHLKVFGCELTKAVRGKYAEFAEEVFEK